MRRFLLTVILGTVTLAVCLVMLATVGGKLWSTSSATTVPAPPPTAYDVLRNLIRKHADARAAIESSEATAERKMLLLATDDYAFSIELSKLGA